MNDVYIVKQNVAVDRINRINNNDDDDDDSNNNNNKPRNLTSNKYIFIERNDQYYISIVELCMRMLLSIT